MVFEIAQHPFRSPLYSALEETTSVAECLLLLFGILAITGGGDFIAGGSSSSTGTTSSSDTDSGEKVVDAANGLAWATIIFSLIAVVFVMMTDFSFNSRSRLYKLRKEKGIVLSEGFFDVRIARGVMLDYISQATAEQIAQFQALEKMLLKKLMKSVMRSSATTDQYQALLAAEPYLLELLVNASANPSTSLAIKDVPFSGLIDKLQALESEHMTGPMPGSFLFTDIMIGPLIRWIIEVATQTEAQLFKGVVDDVVAFHTVREKNAGMCTYVSSFLHYVTMLVDERGRNAKAFEPRTNNKDNGKSEVRTSKETNPPSPNSKRAMLRDMKINRTSVTRAELDIAGFDFAESVSMLQYLAKQISCQTVLLAPVGSDGVISGQIASSNADVSPSTIDGVVECVSTKMPVGFNQSGAALLVPIKDDSDAVIGIIQCLDKVSVISSRMGIPFTKSDAIVAEVCGAIALESGSMRQGAKMAYSANATSCSNAA